MPSKGVQVYTYVAVPGISIGLSVPGQTVRRNELRVFHDENLEVDTKHIPGLLSTTGRFSFKVVRDDGGEVLTEQWIEVNALTGDAGRGTLHKISETQSVVHEASGSIVSYGFYESGTGIADLPDRHQCYVTVTPNYGSWMGQVAPAGSPQAEQPFRKLALPAPHDVGMNSMVNCTAVLAHAGSAVISTMIKESKWAGHLADVVTGKAIEAIAPNIVSSLAITQKDPLTTILQLGARYFEFRPAHCHEAILPSNALPDGLYFQHSAIPGMSYDAFLDDLVGFLQAHPDEIAVVQLRWDGVPDKCKRPIEQDLNDSVFRALAHTDGAIASGNLDDLRNCSIAQLRGDRKRLLVLVNVDSLSTYTDEGNATTSGDAIVAGFSSALHPEAAQGKAFVNIQVQATATNIPAAVAYSVLSASASTSCLLATKALVDSKALPWVRDNTARTCGDDTLVVIMNDFFDGATADVAVELSRQRLQ
ncbi:phospholipase c [Grosmannia clavigera kw1407]|uniref:Phospholipase c n=1 Tax=Grosmannia clavigera (strain kw1407 / UAMH 11150) TaxID=655863 RepID=F0X754_GROCL|nr:phospholipase c [Grosmannia clavigera kw1407]EFX06649.1 phospholipase c [Grosmannia clavigera kw1407]